MGGAHDLEVVGHWLVWLVFAVEVVVMLVVVDDRRAWLAGHQFEVLVVFGLNHLRDRRRAARG